MIPSSTVPGHRVTASVAAVVVVILAVISATSASAQSRDQDDPALAQTIQANQPIVAGSVELSSGHVDLGPRFVDGTWQLLIHDTSTGPPVWREPADVVFRIGDVGRSVLPDDERYSFVGAQPGAPVWVIPQTENPGVVWLGWNTQDPDVMNRVDRGVRLRLVGADGPGKVSVYLQSGNLSGPKVLWESDSTTTEPLWVDVNTHTHANWVFSEPGVYILRIEAVARLIDGVEVETFSDVRLAVGDSTDANGAASAVFAGTEAASTVSGGGADGSAVVAGSGSRSADQGGQSMWVWLVVGIVAVSVIVGGAVVVRSAAERRGVTRGRMTR